MSDIVDTLNLLTEKLNDLFNQTQNYYETFLDANTLYKNDQISDNDFFKKLGDYVVAYSALEFLSIKVIFEIKKAIDKIPNAKNIGATQSPGLMTNTSKNFGSNFNNFQHQQLGTTQNPVGAPPNIISSKNDFSNVGTLPTPDPSLQSLQSTKKCGFCSMSLRPRAKFCTKCGKKV